MSGVTEDGGSFSSKVIRMVFVILLLDLLGFTLILPLLPSILDHYAQTGVRGSKVPPKQWDICVDESTAHEWLVLEGGAACWLMLKQLGDFIFLQDATYQSLQNVVGWFRAAVGIPMEKKYNTVLFGGTVWPALIWRGGTDPGVEPLRFIYFIFFQVWSGRCFPCCSSYPHLWRGFCQTAMADDHC